MKILITGTAGFIGFHLANLLISQGHEVVGLDQINHYYEPELKYSRLQKAGIPKKNIQPDKLIQSELYSNYSFIQMSLEENDKIMRLFADHSFEAVCNLAAQAGVRYSLTNPEVYLQSNLAGFLSILEASRKFPVKHLVYASSSSVYGLNKKMPFSTQHSVDHPISLYAATKKSNELMAHTYSHLFGIPTTGLRFFTVYGPWGRPDMALFIFTKAILEGKPIEVFNNGRMERDFTYVEDIVNGINHVIHHPPGGNPNWNPEFPDPSTSFAPYRLFNIGNSHSVNLMDFIHELENELNKKAIIQYRSLQPGDVEKTWADVNDLEKETGYRPGTSVQEGIKHFVAWYRNYYKV